MAAAKLVEDNLYRKRKLWGLNEWAKWHAILECKDKKGLENG